MGRTEPGAEEQAEDEPSKLTCQHGPSWGRSCALRPGHPLLRHTSPEDFPPPLYQGNGGSCRSLVPQKVRMWVPLGIPCCTAAQVGEVYVPLSWALFQPARPLWLLSVAHVTVPASLLHVPTHPGLPVAPPRLPHANRGPRLLCWGLHWRSQHCPPSHAGTGPSLLGYVLCPQGRPVCTHPALALTGCPSRQVSLQCELSQRYLGGAEDNVTCFAQTVSEGEKWSLHLAQHPNGHMLNPGKQRYMRCDQQTGHMRCDRDLPWGPEAVITLHFDLKEKKYGLRSGAGSLLAADGSLQAELSPQTLYSLELRGGLLALRDADGRYLTGREGTVKTFKTDKPGRDELFALEPSAAQVSLRTFAGGRFVCCRPGADIYANAMSVGNTEIFQLLLNDVTKQACFRSSSGTYLAVGPKDSVVSTSTQDKGVWFSLQYREQRVTLRMADGRHMATRPNGQLLLVPEAAGKGEEFLLLLVNRPLLILQSEVGFVGLFPGTQRLDGNRPAYDASALTLGEDGFCHFRVANKYWSLDQDGLVMASGDHPSNFTLQFWEQAAP
ncbi:fascin-like [Terrapene carolina triunguis]|uniref:fascin-like n=1 Tax=Terrapene triunguis TaxID=2587831 RepID=UPI0011569823|nr:fascin-like [Terrapene carolina triunguis]